MKNPKDLKHNDKTAPAPMMKTGAAANYTGVSPRTLEKWRGTRIDLPFHRLGRAIVYSKGDLDLFLSKNRFAIKGDV